LGSIPLHCPYKYEWTQWLSNCTVERNRINLSFEVDDISGKGFRSNEGLCPSNCTVETSKIIHIPCSSWKINLARVLMLILASHLRCSFEFLVRAGE